jgi:uncharacterized membrane protein YgaE (UPF0421/DUF939 family)
VRRQIYRDRLSTPARVIVGAIIGAFLGLAFWVYPGSRHGLVEYHLSAGVTSLVCAIIIGALVTGIAAGVWGDRLWQEDD